MARQTIKQVSIAYDDLGTGLPVILIHGHPFNRSMWNPQVEALGDDFRVITFDLRGYGESGIASEPMDFSDFAQDIISLADYLEISSFVLVGLSMGGQIAFETWYQAGERIRALVLADTFAGLDTAVNKALRYSTATRVLEEGMDIYAHELLPKMVAATTLLNKPSVAEHVLEMMRTTAPHGAAAALRSRAERRDYIPYLSDITIPTQIIVGREDVFTPVAEAQFMADHIVGSRFDIIEEAGHLPNLEQADQFNIILHSFLLSL